jgi:hypothetical protein
VNSIDSPGTSNEMKRPGSLNGKCCPKMFSQGNRVIAGAFVIGFGVNQR